MFKNEEDGRECILIWIIEAYFNEIFENGMTLYVRIKNKLLLS